MELTQQEIKFYIPASGKISGFSESTDVIIPDSYPDFEETVFSCATINVKDELKQPERILISGQIDAVVLYKGSDEKTLHRLSIPLGFAHVEETKGAADNSLHFMQYTVTQTEVRIVNSRKINVTCTCILRPKAFQRTFVALTCGVEAANSSLQTRMKRCALPMITAVETKRFVILDDLEIADGDGADPLHAEVNFKDVTCSVTNGRVILNGSASLRLWDIQDGCSVSCHTHDIPFHQILDANLLCENIPAEVELSCHSIICHRSNSEILSVNFNTEALFWQQTEQECSWIEDLYDLHCELQTDFQPLMLVANNGPTPFKCTAHETITAPHDVSDILSSELTVSSILPSDEGELKLLLFCSILYLDNAGDLHQIQKQSHVVCTVEQGTPSGLLIDMKCSAIPSFQGNQISLPIAAIGRAYQNNSFTIQNLKELTASPCEHKRPLKLLYLKENTPLWRIAKENKTTLPLITRYNALPENAETVANKILLIP